MLRTFFVTGVDVVFSDDVLGHVLMGCWGGDVALDVVFESFGVSC